MQATPVGSKTAKGCYEESLTLLPTQEISSFGAWFQTQLQRTEKELVKLNACKLDAVWHAPNRKIWENLSSSPTAICKLADANLCAWRQYGKKVSSQSVPPLSSPHACSIPFVCRVDAAWSSPDNVAFGANLLTSSGEFVAASNGILHGTLDPYMAEVMACREALCWLKNQGITKVRLESDCSNAVSALTHIRADHSYTGFIVNQYWTALPEDGKEKTRCWEDDILVPKLFCTGISLHAKITSFDGEPLPLRDSGLANSVLLPTLELPKCCGNALSFGLASETSAPAASLGKACPEVHAPFMSGIDVPLLSPISMFFPIEGKNILEAVSFSIGK
nr:uncharacterized protein LOC109158421 [Ipomoea batatas]